MRKTFQHTSDYAFWEVNITGVDLDSAMGMGAEIQPIDKTSLEEMKQSDNLRGVDENNSEPTIVIKQAEERMPEADVGLLTNRDYIAKTLKPKLKIDVSV